MWEPNHERYTPTKTDTEELDLHNFCFPPPTFSSATHVLQPLLLHHFFILIAVIFSPPSLFPSVNISFPRTALLFSLE